MDSKKPLIIDASTVRSVSVMEASAAAYEDRDSAPTPGNVEDPFGIMPDDEQGY